MKTAVEFLVERLAENGILHSFDIAQAKAMEKQQLNEAYRKGYFSEAYPVESKQYYNETFKTK